MAFAVVVSAETRDLFLPNFEGALAASVIGESPTATTYLIGCPIEATSVQCGIWGKPTTHTQGPKTVHYAITLTPEGEAPITQEYGCILASTTSATCSVTEISGTGIITLSTTLDLTDPDFSDIWTPVTIIDDSKSVQDTENAAKETGAAAKPTAAGSNKEDEGSMTAMSTSPSTGFTTGLVTSAPTALQTGPATESADVPVTESTGMAAQATALGSFAVGLVAAGLAVAAL